LRSDGLSPLILLGVWRSGKRHAIHQAYLIHVAERRRREGRAPIAWALLKQTIARHEVAALERAEALAPSGRSAEHRRRDAVKAAVTLWNSCLAITRKEAKLKIVVDTDSPALCTEFETYADVVSVHEVPPHRWLGIRRGERLGALRLEFQLPMERLQAQIEARKGSLTAVAGGRDDETLLQTLILTDLVQWVLSLKDEEAQFLAMRSAGETYLNMLLASPPSHRVFAAVSIPESGPVGLAVLLKDGRIVGHDSVENSERLVGDLERAIGNHPVEALILPSDTKRPDILRTVADGFAALSIIQTSTNALDVAIEAVVDDVQDSVKAAIVLGCRTLKPKDHWLELDPVSLGLAEYQQEISERELREIYAEMQAFARADIDLSQLQRGGSAQGARVQARPSLKSLNPLVKNTEDLRAGMQLDGMVTNITQFGAFVNVGLPHEGLVHVSELADHFVSDPNEVVTIGQTVRATVLGIDVARRRISLSMRTKTTVDRKPESTIDVDRIDGPSKRRGELLDDIPGRSRPAARPSANRGRPSVNVSRSQALADLEALFKKK
jgi:transcriptional accessory protein Tex/SPT6